MDWDILFEIHKDMPRQGAGRNKYTKKAFEMIPKINTSLILDIGCGPGLQTIYLAKISKGNVIGIDIHQPYLDNLNKLAERDDLQDKIKTIKMSMMEMDFPEEHFDIIWAEGSIFVIGFENGLKQWKKYIKPNGFLAVHEMTWLKDNPPKELNDWWQKVYPEIKTIDEDLKIIDKCGYKLLGHFALPEDAWWDLYYTPLEKRLKVLKEKYKDNLKFQEAIRLEEEEIELFRKYNEWYGSVFYVMQKK